MSASTVIGDLTETLRDLLQNTQQPPNTFDVSLLSPVDEIIEQGMRPRINLFLLRAQESPFVKNQDWNTVGFGEFEYPPLGLNLLYLLTAFAAEKIDEYRVMGEAMRILHDNPILQGAALRGSLRDTAEELAVDLCPFTLEELTKIWNAFSKPLRLSICYEVRTVRIDSRLRREARLVTTKIEQFKRI